MSLNGAGLLVGAALTVLVALAFATVFLGVIATLRISHFDDHPSHPDKHPDYRERRSKVAIRDNIPRTTEHD
ncbi:hypothetical protein ABTX81_33765 [Kitasatospora sp. NPDC097605]|uniref:hypothetical protein n=1 Tax=Kitasatospora sp. NPDC097605 TaxID=3157226 RepID=UPI0033313626